MILVQNRLLQLSGNKILLVLALFFASFSWAQPGEVETEFVKGKEYWVHVVQEGNTLYAIKTTYKTDIPTILANNPGMDQNLQIGQKIYIPTGKTELEVKQGNATVHEVSKGETLYGLSKKYNCTQAELIELNPGIEKGLKLGQELRIPTKEVVKVETPIIIKEPVKPEVDIVWNDSIVEHMVLSHETLYSISKRYMVPVNEIKEFNGIRKNNIKEGSIVKIKLKKIEKYEVVQKDLPIPNQNLIDDTTAPAITAHYAYKDQYNVVIAMPFCLDQNASVMKRNQMSGKTDLYNYTALSLDFYMGAMLAVDSLKKKGLNVVVDVIDTKKDTNVLKRFIESDKFKNADLIFGPRHRDNIALMSKSMQLNPAARLVLPFTSNTKYVLGNSQVYLALASSTILIEKLAERMVLEHGGHHIVLLGTGKEKDEYLSKIFKSKYNEVSLLYPGTRVITESTIGSASGRDFASKIQRKDTNIIICLSEDRTNASKVMTTLNKVKNKSGGYDDAHIEVYGMSAWEKYKEIKIPYKLKLNLHIPVSFHLNYELVETKKMMQSYRNKYKTDPNRDAIHSFDVANYFLSNFFMERKPSQVMNNFDMIQKGEFDGFQNNNLNIVYYNDYEVLLQK